MATQMEADRMATGHTHGTTEKPLTDEQKARVEAIRARHRTPEARAAEAKVREALDREYRETGTLKTTGDWTTTEEFFAFRRFMMSLRRERERLGLSLNDVAARAGIDKGALSRLENGQQFNPTVNTLTRYVHALGKVMAWAVRDEEAGEFWLNVDRPTKKATLHFDGGCEWVRSKAPTPRKGVGALKVDGGWLQFPSEDRARSCFDSELAGPARQRRQKPWQWIECPKCRSMIDSKNVPECQPETVDGCQSIGAQPG
jgi:transcriptional regulator with XRE-family HTH domain